MSSSPPILRAEGLHVRFGGVEALGGVSCDVQAGEFFGIIGPNGAGKTTLLRVLHGVVRLAAGTVALGGMPVAQMSPREVARAVAVLPQEWPAVPACTALEVVLTGRLPHLRALAGEGPQDVAAARGAMVRTDTWALAARPMVTLSGGERRRVLLARALAQEARVLLLDEPTAHLDIAHQVETMAMLRGLCADGLTVVAALHDLNLAGQCCDRLLLLHRGRILACGTPEAVMTPGLLREAYGVEVAVQPHPATGRPVAFLPPPVAAGARS